MGILGKSDSDFKIDWDKVREGLRERENTFRCIVAGSRGYSNYNELCSILDNCLKNVTQNIEIVTGGAKGTDTLAEKYADERGYKKKIMPADWGRYGKSAGYRRNEAMHRYISECEHNGVVCFWDGASKGTAHNFNLAKDRRTDIRIYDYIQKKPLSLEDAINKAKENKRENEKENEKWVTFPDVAPDLDDMFLER